MSEPTLNEQIARAMGYRVAEYRPFRNTQVWQLIAPDGAELLDGSVKHPYGDSEQDAWQHAPDYEHDLNAVEAELSSDWSLEIWTTGDDKPAGMVRRGSQCFYGRDATTRKEAAAKALLEWAKWQQAQAESTS